LLRGLALDLLAWCCMPAAFLFVCVSRHLLPAEAVIPHLRLVMLPLLGLALLRLMLSAAGLGVGAVRLAAALAAAVLLTVMASYYVLVVIGLQSWGRVVSWDLITSYGAQAPMLADALEIPLLVVVAVIALVYAALFGAAWAYLRHFDWVPALRRAVAPWLSTLMVCAAGAVGAIELYSFLLGPPTAESEPVSLTFNPTETAEDFQGHAIEQLKAASLDAAEDLARGGYRPAPSAERKNVILIVVDALRSDHMGIYGYARDTTPNLARLEKAGILRKAAAVRASCSSSLCGLLSIAASKYVHQLSKRPITLQEVLKRHGYRSHMILSGNHRHFYGLKAAYGEVDVYYDAFEAGGFRFDRYMNDDRAMLEYTAGYPSWDGNPVVIQFHLMAAHPLHTRDGQAIKYAPAANYVVHRDHDAGGRPGQRAINFYDNGVLQADATIREILETLGRKGYLKNALVAITADHGEALGEHGVYQHANSVREEVLRIPFVLLSYGHRPGRPLQGASLASQVDIAPTILAELGMPPPATWKGAALQDPVSRDFLPFQERWEMGLYDLRDPRTVWKYWINIKTGAEYAFDLTADPAEHLNAIGKLSPQHKRELRLQVLSRSPASARRRFDDPVER
jgi:glucan phosphoethanolaminetransferase (alkaline phosphatase superfamily)